MTINPQQHGGIRRGAGRPKLRGELIMKSVKLSVKHWQRAKEIGEGNMAEGLRRALDGYKAQD